MKSLESYRADVLRMLTKIHAPAEMAQTAKDAKTIEELKAVCFASMSLIGEDMITLADAFKKLGYPAEAARTKVEGTLAMEPWRAIKSKAGL